MTKEILLILLVVFALAILHQKRLRAAVIWMGVFSLLASVIYLYNHAPDVAIAEAVIGSTISTVLFLVVLRKQERLLEEEKENPDLSGLPKKLDKTPIFQRIVSGIFVMALCALFLFLYLNIDVPSLPPFSEHYKENFIGETASKNAVTSIYLNYRIYDTFFETLTLLVSVFGVVFLSRFPSIHSNSVIVTGDECRLHITQERDEHIPAPLIRFISPFILLLGLYIILNGHISPGGGFQGGAILAGVFILRYMTQPENDIRLQVLQNAEKIFYLLLVMLPVVFLMQSYTVTSGFLNTAYLILMNIFIGLKVGCAISIIFIRYIFYESR